MIIGGSRQQKADVVDQSIVMDSGTDQGVLRMDQEGISAEEQARRRLRSKQPARRSLTDDEKVSKRLKREATIAAIKKEILKTVAERPDLEHAHKFHSSIRTLRSPESIHASRMVEINKWRERGVAERWSRQAAMATGRQMGWMNNTRRSHDMWSRTSRTDVIRRCLQPPVIQQWEEW